MRGALVNLGVLVASSAAALAVAWIVLVSLERDPRRLLARDVDPNILADQRTGIYRDDPWLGWALEPGAQGVHEKKEFRVTYTVDSDGCRLVPGSASSPDEVVFVGGSFTFGHGVEDHETFSAVLARGPWTGYRVRNCAVSGWGTSSSYLWLKRELASGRPPPRAVFYAFLAAHPDRNYLVDWWLDNVALYGRKLPHFELENGRLAFQGTVGSEAGLEDSKQVNTMQRKLTRQMLREMDEMCREHGVAFWVLVLPGSNSPRDGRLVRSLEKAGIQYLDLRGQVPQGLVYPEDRHPVPAWHRALASAIATARPLEPRPRP